MPAPSNPSFLPSNDPSKMNGSQVDTQAGRPPLGPTTSSNSLSARERRYKTNFGTQAKAVLRKNLQQQRRAVCTNVFIIATPIFFCLLLFALQTLINKAIDTRDNRCGCECLLCCDETNTTMCEVPPNGVCLPSQECTTYNDSNCGLQYSSAEQFAFCPVASPSVWPALLSMPSNEYLARPWGDNGTAAMFVTGDNQEKLESGIQLFPDPPATPADQAAADKFFEIGAQTGAIYSGAFSLLGAVLGSSKFFQFYSYFFEPAFFPTDTYDGNMTLASANAASPSTQAASAFINANLSKIAVLDLKVTPIAVQQVWQPSVDAVNSALYCGYKEARCGNGVSVTNGFTNAFDFGDTDPDTGVYNVRVWYNSTDRYSDFGSPTQVVRVHAPINAAANAFMRWALNGLGRVRLVGILEMPKPGFKLTLDIASLVGTLFYTWLLQLLLPFMLSILVSEKEGRLRTMMKMHGLGDAAYWTIQFCWYTLVNFIYTWILIGAGSGIGLAFFTRTDYSFQFVFYLLWNLCLVSFTFLLSTLFRSTRTAVVVAFLYVFGTGLIGYLLLQQFVGAGHWWAVFFNIVPGFALYRGLYEIAQYAFRAAYQGNEGITWARLSDPGNGLPAVMGFFAAEAVIFAVLAWYLEKVLPGGVGVPRHPLFFLGKKFSSEVGGKGGDGSGIPPPPPPSRHWWQFWKSSSSSSATTVAVSLRPDSEVPSTTISGSNGIALTVESEPEDVAEERRRVEALLAAGPAVYTDQAAILVKNLRKVFPGRVKKVAVQDLELAVANGECFGLLGPNGAGKSTTLNILTGFLTPSSGTAVIQGHDIRSDMEDVYGIMGVCPQDNLLWARLTGREHLGFYGRLKGLKGQELEAAIETGLRSVNLWNGGVADKQVRTFSGGMKRRLSVAISLMGDPLVVYMDEPSTGLDPASRQNLWSVVKAAKRGRGIILTTHSMEEAAAVCDRLGIFVDGQLVCIGAPKELTARYGGYLVFSITTQPGKEHDDAADALARRLAPSAKLTYSLGGTRRYELPTAEVSLSKVFETMEGVARSGEVAVLDWGVANATLEEVFLKFARSIGAEGGH